VLAATINTPTKSDPSNFSGNLGGLLYEATLGGIGAGVYNDGETYTLNIDITNVMKIRTVNTSTTFTIDGSRLPSGLYFYRLDAGDRALTRKMVLLK